MDKKYFPIRTATSCQSKWGWTTLYINSGRTSTCHRTSATDLTPENFMNFHNTDMVLEDRRRMLQGLWPEGDNCAYCRKIEEKGGVSDRMRQLEIPNLTPSELESDPNAIVVSPTIVEVFFSNVCNLGCLYCHPAESSVINAENKKFGPFEKDGLKFFDLEETKTKTKELSPYFWQWFPEGFPKLKRLGFLGGEPLYQKEFDTLLEMINRYPNPDCELNIVTNLMAPYERVERMVEDLKKLVLARKIRRVDITVSIDCWGPQQEFVRYGLDLDVWEKNFELLLKNRWIYLVINQTITVLTIKTMPALLEKMNEWSNKYNHKIHHHFSGPTPGPSYFNAGILGGEEFANDFKTILDIMPKQHDEDFITLGYMQGLSNFILTHQRDPAEIKKLFVFLDEKDRRRGTNWVELFPWLEEYRQYVV